jgi:hypothetical protein
MCVVSALVLNAFSALLSFWGVIVFEGSSGKLLVYASCFSSRESRLKQVSLAAEKVARQLRVDAEVKTFRKRFTSIYVYYKDGDDEPVPIYCNNGEKSNAQEVYATLRNMMFVLSFHPKHSALRRMRKELMQLS